MYYVPIIQPLNLSFSTAMFLSVCLSCIHFCSFLILSSLFSWSPLPQVYKQTSVLICIFKFPFMCYYFMSQHFVICILLFSFCSILFFIISHSLCWPFIHTHLSLIFLCDFFLNPFPNHSFYYSVLRSSSFSPIFLYHLGTLCIV